MLNYDNLKIGDEITILIYGDRPIRTKIIAFKGKKVRRLQVEYSRLWYKETELNKYVLDDLI